MKPLPWLTLLILAACLLPRHAKALERTGHEFKIFQFPPDRIPRVDGDPSDWAMVPESYVIGTDQLRDTVGSNRLDRLDLDVRVKVGWVRGMNQLWFLYEADDNYWDFSKPDLHNDIFELVVDGDLSGGPLIKDMHPVWKDRPDGYMGFQGYHAQNYHIFTPAVDKDWAMVWGGQSWIKDLPYANAAYRFSFKPGDRGHLVLEFWITPFDYAPSDGPSRAVVSKLVENQLIGMSWSILDYDDVNSDRFKGFWNLSHKTTMYGHASDLCLFRLMPLEPPITPRFAAHWSFKVLSTSRREVAFEDQSTGTVTRRTWDFGDGTSSRETHPVHTYSKPGQYVVVLTIEGPAGSARFSRVWDVSF